VLSNDNPGADGYAATGAVIGVRAAGVDTTSSVSTGIDGTITGLHGNLVMHADGSYTYTQTGSVSADAEDKFVYSVKDGDGDISTTTLTVTVHDVAPSIPTPTNFNILTNLATYDDSGKLKIPVAALLAHEGITDPHTHVTVTGVTVVNGFVEVTVPGNTGSFTYSLTDGSQTTGSATVSITRDTNVTDGTNSVDFFIGRDWGATYDSKNSDDIVIKYGATVEGKQGNDVLFGIGGSNTLNGGEGNDVLFANWTGGHSSTLDGGQGNDILHVGHVNGTTIMKGGQGADTFVFEAYSYGNGSNQITDYSKAENDVIDISNMLNNYNGGADSNWVKVVGNQLQVDRDGAAGADTFHTVATLNGSPPQLQVLLDASQAPHLINAV
jgi:Ca2+-binding RTX toxin-like protein